MKFISMNLPLLIILCFTHLFTVLPVSAQEEVPMTLDLPRGPYPVVDSFSKNFSLKSFSDFSMISFSKTYPANCYEVAHNNQFEEDRECALGCYALLEVCTAATDHPFKNKRVNPK